MGCVSEAGCLGPRRREREVYIDLIESIHQEALTISTVSGTSS